MKDKTDGSKNFEQDHNADAVLITSLQFGHLKLCDLKRKEEFVTGNLRNLSPNFLTTNVQNLCLFL